jgi:hypothetical protein
MYISHRGGHVIYDGFTTYDLMAMPGVKTVVNAFEKPQLQLDNADLTFHELDFRAPAATSNSRGQSALTHRLRL